MVHLTLILLFLLFGNFLRLLSFLEGVALKAFVFLPFYSLFYILITSLYSIPFFIFYSLLNILFPSQYSNHF